MNPVWIIAAYCVYLFLKDVVREALSIYIERNRYSMSYTRVGKLMKKVLKQ